MSDAVETPSQAARQPDWGSERIYPRLQPALGGGLLVFTRRACPGSAAEDPRPSFDRLGCVANHGDASACWLAAGWPFLDTLSVDVQASQAVGRPERPNCNPTPSNEDGKHRASQEQIPLYQSSGENRTARHRRCRAGLWSECSQSQMLSRLQLSFRRGCGVAPTSTGWACSQRS